MKANCFTCDDAETMFEYNKSNWGDLDDSDEQSEFQSNDELPMEHPLDSPDFSEVTVEEKMEFREQFDKLVPTRGCISIAQKSLSTPNLSSHPAIPSKALLEPEKSENSRWTRNSRILRSGSTNDINKGVHRRKRRQKHVENHKDKRNDTKGSSEHEKPKSNIGKPILKQNSSWADVVRCSN